jgi:hypothetical protein
MAAAGDITAAVGLLALWDEVLNTFGKIKGFMNNCGHMLIVKPAVQFLSWCAEDS